jgi:C-terminal processing protease CtpA/Prc
VRAGDVVLSIDGNRVRPDDGSDAVSVSLPRNRDAQLEIIRDSARQSVMLPPRR